MAVSKTELICWISDDVFTSKSASSVQYGEIWIVKSIQCCEALQGFSSSAPSALGIISLTERHTNISSMQIAYTKVLKYTVLVMVVWTTPLHTHRGRGQWFVLVWGHLEVVFLRVLLWDLTCLLMTWRRRQNPYQSDNTNLENAGNILTTAGGSLGLLFRGI